MKWISVKDRLPEVEEGLIQRLLMYGPISPNRGEFIYQGVYFNKYEGTDGVVLTGFFAENDCEECGEENLTEELVLTHWMPLPDPPEAQ